LRRYFPSHNCGNNDQTQGVVSVWTTTVALIVIGWALQIVGHSLFERRRPALLDNPIHMLISPMFIVAKLSLRLGSGAMLQPFYQSSRVDKAMVALTLVNSLDTCLVTGGSGFIGQHR
jgi:uncharacterized membrane protein YGL010W